MSVAPQKHAWMQKKRVDAARTAPGLVGARDELNLPVAINVVHYGTMAVDHGVRGD